MAKSNKTVTAEVIGMEETTAAGSGTETASVAAVLKTRTKLVKVEQRYIDCLLKRTPMGPFPALSDEIIDAIRDTPEERERYRRLQAEAMALLKKARDEEDAVLEQYHAQGFAVVEVTDDSEAED